MQGFQQENANLIKKIALSCKFLANYFAFCKFSGERVLFLHSAEVTMISLHKSENHMFEKISSIFLAYMKKK